MADDYVPTLVPDRQLRKLGHLSQVGHAGVGDLGGRDRQRVKLFQSSQKPYPRVCDIATAVRTTPQAPACLLDRQFLQV